MLKLVVLLKQLVLRLMKIVQQLVLVHFEDLNNICIQLDLQRPLLNSFFITHIVVFLWGFAHNLNPILILHLKKVCQLTNCQN
jgi:hypothetical protein